MYLSNLLVGTAMARYLSRTYWTHKTEKV